MAPLALGRPPGARCCRDERWRIETMSFVSAVAAAVRWVSLRVELSPLCPRQGHNAPFLRAVRLSERGDETSGREGGGGGSAEW